MSIEPGPGQFACCDASIIIRIVSGSDEDPAQKLWSRLADASVTVVARRLLSYEVTSVLYRTARIADAPNSELIRLLDRAFSLGIEFRDDLELHFRAALLSREFNLPAAYDSHYLALAESLDCRFYTSDAMLVQAVGEKLNWVHLV